MESVFSVGSKILIIGTGCVVKSKEVTSEDLKAIRCVT